MSCSSLKACSVCGIIRGIKLKHYFSLRRFYFGQAMGRIDSSNVHEESLRIEDSMRKVTNMLFCYLCVPWGWSHIFGSLVSVFALPHAHLLLGLCVCAHARSCADGNVFQDSDDLEGIVHASLPKSSWNSKTCLANMDTSKIIPASFKGESWRLRCNDCTDYPIIKKFLEKILLIHLQWICTTGR